MRGCVLIGRCGGQRNANKDGGGEGDGEGGGGGEEEAKDIKYGCEERLKISTMERVDPLVKLQEIRRRKKKEKKKLQ